MNTPPNVLRALRSSLHSFALILAGFVIPGSSFADTIYVSSDLNGPSSGLPTITKFDPDGTRSTFAPDLRFPHGMAFDSAGNLYVASYGDNTITKFTSGGGASVFANTGLNHPMDLACDRYGNIYVSNEGAYDSGMQQYHSYIQKFTSAGAGSLFADATARDPDGLTVDSSGNLYVAYRINQPAIMRFTPDGEASVFASTGIGFNSAQDIAFDSSGNLYASYGPLGIITKFSPNGVNMGIFASGLANPVGLAFDSSDNLYAVNFLRDNGYVARLTPDGDVSVFAGGLTYPVFIAIIPEPSAGALLILVSATLLWNRKK